ncbi:MAG: DNA gyrase subunit A, partial [Ruminococcus sp.]|nr:DNA gyrase subunit A [Ruminococcus sp.]
EGSKAAKGTNIVNLLPITLEDKITAIIRIKNIEGTYDPDYKQGFIFIATRDGIIKRTKLSEFENINRGGKYAIILNEGDEIAGVVLTSGDTEMLVATKKGRLQRFIETEVRSMGRMSRGVKGIKFKSDEDIIIGIAKVREDATVLTITEKGFGRRAEISEYTAHGRRSQGLTNYKPNEQTGDVAGIKVVDIEDDIIIISDFGMLIRVRAADIRQCSRTSKGVRIMRLKNDDEKIVSFTRVDHEEDAEIADIDGEEIPDIDGADGDNSEIQANEE